MIQQQSQSTVDVAGAVTKQKRRCLPNIPAGIGTDSVQSRCQPADVQFQSSSASDTSNTVKLMRRKLITFNGITEEGDSNNHNNGVPRSRYEYLQRRAVDDESRPAQRGCRQDVTNSADSANTELSSARSVGGKCLTSRDITTSVDCSSFTSGGDELSRQTMSISDGGSESIDDERHRQVSATSVAQDITNGEHVVLCLSPGQQQQYSPDSGCSSLYDVMHHCDLHRVSVQVAPLAAGSRGGDDVISIDAELLTDYESLTGSDCSPHCEDRMLSGQMAIIGGRQTKSAFRSRSSPSSCGGIVMVTVISVSGRLLTVDNSRHLTIGDILIEINGHYVFGQSVDVVRHLLTSYDCQRLQLIVASRRLPTSDCYQDNASSLNVTGCSQSVSTHRSPGVAAVSGRPHVRFLHPSTDVTAVDQRKSINNDVTVSNDGGGRRENRSISFSDKPNTVRMIERSSISDDVRDHRYERDKHQHRVNNNNRSDRFNPRETKRGHVSTKTGNDANSGLPEVVGDRQQRTLNGNIWPSDDDRVEPIHHPSLSSSSRRQSDNEDRLYRLHQASRDCRTSRTVDDRHVWNGADSMYSAPSSMPTIIDFVPLSPSDNDDDCSSSSDGSLMQETIYDEEYGWQCVTAV